MILDKLLEFDPLPTALTTTRDSTNIIDLANNRDMGIGFPLWVTVATGSVAVTGGTSVDIALRASVDDVTYHTVMTSGPIVTAQLTASRPIWRAPIAHRPPNFGGTFPRYYKLVYTIVGTYSAGGVGAWLNLDTQSAPAYPPGIAITN